MTTVLSSDCHIEIPEVFREEDALRPGQSCEIERLGRGDYRLRVAPGEPVNWVEWLLACPEKDWLGEPNRSEMTRSHGASEGHDDRRNSEVARADSGHS